MKFPTIWKNKKCSTPPPSMDWSKTINGLIWIDLREMLQETIGFSVKYKGIRHQLSLVSIGNDCNISMIWKCHKMGPSPFNLEPNPLELKLLWDAHGQQSGTRNSMIEFKSKQIHYHLVMTNIAMENPISKWRFLWENHLFPWAIYTMAMLNNQRVHGLMERSLDRIRLVHH